MFPFLFHSFCFRLFSFPSESLIKSSIKNLILRGKKAFNFASSLEAGGREEGGEIRAGLCGV
jgi:hypothetical protein